MHVVLFTSDDQTFAIPTRCIVEVIPAVQWRPLPASESWLKGLFNYRATLLPLVDFGLLLGRDARPLHRTARILIVRSADPQEAETHSAKLGLLVQRVLGSEQLDVGEAAAGRDEVDTRASSEPQPPREARPDPTREDLPTGPGTHAASGPSRMMTPEGCRAGTPAPKSLLGPVVLTSTGTVQLIRAAGLPAPRLT